MLTVVTTVATGYIQCGRWIGSSKSRSTLRGLGEAARLQRVRFEEAPSPRATTSRPNRNIARLWPGCRGSSANRAAGELHQRAARSKPGPIARGRDITLWSSAVPSELPAACSSAGRYPWGRGKPNRRQCRHRRGEGGVFSRYQPYRAAGPGKRPARICSRPPPRLGH